jgi:flagellar hook-basal body complex protein FliE
MINPITPIAPTAIEGLAALQPAGRPGEFQSLLKNAIQVVETNRIAANQAVQGFMTGEGGELHTTILATQKAELSLELFLQVRNKVVQAYQEIMRTQI